MSDSLSPIVFFTYNRPWHTQQVLDSLAENSEAKDSILYIFCDGAKESATEDILNNIATVRKIIKDENRFKQVIISLQDKNKGLANSIIEGVTKVVNIHGKVIVLEDDIFVSKGFLKYMNDALNIYVNEEKVGCIHSWNYNLNMENYRESTFFLKGADCWGWATWKRAWVQFEPNGVLLLEKIVSNNLQYNFDRRGTHEYVKMLKEQIENKIESWAILWHASLFLNDMFCLHPTRTIVKNIGLDNSGVHCGNSNIIQNPIDFIHVQKIKIQEADSFYNSYKDYRDATNSLKKYLIKQKVKNIFKQSITPIIFKFFKKNKKQIQPKNEAWSGDFSTWEEAQTKCDGYDSAIILEKCKNALLKVKIGEEVYERDSVLFDEIQYSWGLLAGLQKASIENDNKLCVMDFGGSLGSTYYQNKEFLSGLKSIEWCIVEQAHFVDCGKENFENEHLKFYYTIEECLLKHKPNVLVLSSVLQYLENPYQWIELFIKTDIPFIILDRTPFIDSENDILTIQNVPENIYKASYPSWFFDKKKLISTFSNYSLIAETYNSYTNDFIINNHKAKWTGMILKQKK